MKSGNLNSLEPSGPLQACNGTTFTCYVTENTLVFNLMFTTGHVICWPCSRNVSVLPEDGHLSAETRISVNRNRVVLMYISALILIKIQPDATVCIYLFTAKSLYMFQVSQHPSSGVLKTANAAFGTGHNIGTATSLQRGMIRPRWREVVVPVLRSDHVGGK